MANVWFNLPQSLKDIRWACGPAGFAGSGINRDLIECDASCNVAIATNGIVMVRRRLFSPGNLRPELSVSFQISRAALRSVVNRFTRRIKLSMNDAVGSAVYAVCEIDNSGKAEASILVGSVVEQKALKLGSLFDKYISGYEAGEKDTLSLDPKQLKLAMASLGDECEYVKLFSHGSCAVAVDQHDETNMAIVMKRMS